MNPQLKSVLVRFAKGAVSGGVMAMGLVKFIQPGAWSDFPTLLNSLGIAFAGGAVVGLLLALEKWASWTDVPPVSAPTV